MTQCLYAFIDEAGQRAMTDKSSDHFVMAAVILEEARLDESSKFLTKLRQDLRRGPSSTIHWQKLKSHSDRLHAAKALSSEEGVTISSVVVCKHALASTPLPDEHTAYLFTLRMLLERLSWYARDLGNTIEYTLSAITRFKTAQLRQYEDRLKHMPDCTVEWSALHKGGQINQPNRVEQLQMADIAASAIFKAFEPDEFGNTETRYLDELSSALYRRESGPVTSYGLKLHPLDDITKSAHDWVNHL